MLMDEQCACICAVHTHYQEVLSSSHDVDISTGIFFSPAGKLDVPLSTRLECPRRHHLGFTWEPYSTLLARVVLSLYASI